MHCTFVSRRSPVYFIMHAATPRTIPGWLPGVLTATVAPIAPGFGSIGVFASVGGLIIVSAAALALGTIVARALRSLARREKHRHRRLLCLRRCCSVPAHFVRSRTCSATRVARRAWRLPPASRD